tara:strand:- start:307 stop:1077 length:771 start_codon:yes stop_codon:yes gene_type:complete
MPQLRERLLLVGLQVHYIGTPTIKLFSDGVQKMSFTAPNHATYKTKMFSAPQGVYGHLFDITSNSTELLEYGFMTATPKQYTEQLIWHYYDITFSGTVNLTLFLDEISKVSGKQITTTKGQETKKVYMPALSYGRVPHVTNATDDTGEIYSWQPTQLPARFYSGEKSVSEVKITYRGNVTLELYFDGDQMGDDIQLNGDKNNSAEDIYTVETIYVSAGSIGKVFQWVQSEGDGDVISVETDAHTVEEQPVSIPEPT